MPSKSFLMTMALSLKQSSNSLDETKGNYLNDHPMIYTAMVSAMYVTGALAKAYEDAAIATDDEIMVNGDVAMTIIPPPD
jgi:hypothetical protein